jgi:hypothetical protein
MRKNAFFEVIFVDLVNFSKVCFAKGIPVSDCERRARHYADERPPNTATW